MTGASSDAMFHGELQYCLGQKERAQRRSIDWQRMPMDGGSNCTDDDDGSAGRMVMEQRVDDRSSRQQTRRSQ